MQGEGFRGIEVVPQIEAEGCERFEGSWQEAFTAGFIERRPSGVDHLDMQALVRRGDGGGEASGASTDDQDVWLDRAKVHRRNRALCTMTLSGRKKQC